MNNHRDIFANTKKIDVSDLNLGEKHSKLCRGDKVDATYKMTHKKNSKRYFLKDVPFSKHLIDAVIASKIARMINKQHFSSEKWLSDGRVVSEAVVENAIPHPHASRQAFCVRQFTETPSENERKKLMNQLTAYNNRRINHHIKGLGIIDEVCAFIGESDPNCENLMFSNEAFDNNTIAIKIDFDGCMCSSSEWSALFYKDSSMIYGTQVYDKVPVEYIMERAQTRLKLSLISDDLIGALLEKYCPENIPEFEKALVSNRNSALQQLNSQEYGLIKLLDNEEGLKKTISDFHGELIHYCQKHFPEKLNTLTNDLNERLAFVQAHITNELQLSPCSRPFIRQR